MKLVSIVAALVAFASVASAQPRKADPKKPPPVKVITIGEGEDIDGGVPTGELIPINIREQGKSSSLLHIRHDFIDMILKSAEDMR